MRGEVAQDPDALFDPIAPWRRWLCGLTIVVASTSIIARNNEAVFSP